jgi:hypothetical protein
LAAAIIVGGSLLGAAKILAPEDCDGTEATARLKNDIPADTIEIIHARIPCRAQPCFFGYRFRAKMKGEVGDGDVCWSVSTRQWTWRILPESSLSRLNLSFGVQF